MALKSDHYTYRVTWSEDDGEYVGLCTEFLSLSWLDESPESALIGIRNVVSDVVADLEAKLEESTSKYNDIVEQMIEVREAKEKADIAIAFKTVSEDLTDTQVEKLRVLSEGVSYESVEEFTTKMEAIKTSYFAEQTPSPVVDEETRARVGELVVNAAHAVNYTNLGTAEFLRADNGEFYFIEINARLQVEHPITEFVSGLDLVKLQLDIANGEPIPFKQSDLKMNGYAIECRINAEDTFMDFAPSTGPVPDVTIPAGPSVRCDTYLYPGCTVSPYYDSLMAKLVTWGQTFEESRTRMLAALNDFYIQGVETSIPLYKTILNSDEYKNGDLSTDFLKRYDIINRLTADLKTEKENKTDAALAAAIIHSEYFKSRIHDTTAHNSHWKDKLD